MCRWFIPAHLSFTVRRLYIYPRHFHDTVDDDMTIPLQLPHPELAPQARRVRSNESKAVHFLLLLAVPALILGTALAGTMAFRSSPQAAHAAAGPVPGGMPGHFSFGVMDSPGGQTYLNGMRTNNGTALDFRYQYLSGGAGTGWSTWNSPAGQFATYYMNDSDNNGYIPSFVYYNMLQSSGPSGSSESGTALAHLGNATTMNAYFGDWALLMQKAGAYGKPVLVVVEPDLWGFIQQAASAKGSTSAASVPASVASSGYSSAQGYPNTAQGFAWTLLHMRDQYAKNAILTLHASPWGTGTDIASNTSSGVDAAAIGTQTAQFLSTEGIAGNPSGVSTFDLISNDIADHDSGQSGIWWDRNNATFPNFSRYLQYANALSNGTGRRIVMWQVPEGNQYFDTQDNSAGHTQDNKAEYIIGHIADFANAGVVSVLFGPGNGGTYAQDMKGDGVTNPAPISTYECNLCNNHTSSYADDDGGYLRLFLGQYYKNGVYALSGGSTAPAPTSTTPPQPTTTPTTAPSSPSCTPTINFGANSASPSSVTQGGTVALSTTFTASCATSANVDFEVYDAAGTKIWQNVLSNQSLTGQPQTFNTSWTTSASQATGTYTLKIGVFKPDWSATYAWNNSAATFSVQGGAAACGTTSPAISFGGASASPSTVARGTGTALSVTLNASCQTNGLIDFEVYNSAGAKVFQVAQDNQALTGQSQTFTTMWNVPTSQATGTYTFKIGVFKPGWGTLYAWNNSATTFTVN